MRLAQVLAEVSVRFRVRDYVYNSKVECTHSYPRCPWELEHHGKNAAKKDDEIDKLGAKAEKLGTMLRTSTQENRELKALLM